MNNVLALLQMAASLLVSASAPGASYQTQLNAIQVAQQAINCASAQIYGSVMPSNCSNLAVNYPYNQNPYNPNPYNPYNPNPYNPYNPNPTYPYNQYPYNQYPYNQYPYNQNPNNQYPYNYGGINPPNLSYTPANGRVVNISWNYNPYVYTSSVYNSYNNYAYINVERSIYPGGPWARVASQQPATQSSISDTNIPYGMSTLYYRIVPTDLYNNQGTPSAVATVDVSQGSGIIPYNPYNPYPYNPNPYNPYPYNQYPYYQAGY